MDPAKGVYGRRSSQPRCSNVGIQRAMRRLDARLNLSLVPTKDSPVRVEIAGMERCPARDMRRSVWSECLIRRSECLRKRSSYSIRQLLEGCVRE